MTYQLGNAIDKFLIEEENAKRAERAKNAEENPKPPSFYPSSIGFCSRRIAMQMLGYERPDMDPRILRIMDNGTYTHHRYEDLFDKMGIQVEREVVLKDEELRISGRTDSHIRFKDENGNEVDALVELKSAKDSQFNRMKKEGEPRADHYDQLQLYMHLTGIHKGVIFVENKDTQDTLEFWVDYDEERANQLIEKIRMINACVDMEILPEKEFEITSFECRFCDFRYLCWEEEIEE